MKFCLSFLTLLYLSFGEVSAITFQSWEDKRRIIQSSGTLLQETSLFVPVALDKRSIDAYFDALIWIGSPDNTSLRILEDLNLDISICKDIRGALRKESNLPIDNFKLSETIVKENTNIQVIDTEYIRPVLLLDYSLEEWTSGCERKSTISFEDSTREKTISLTSRASHTFALKISRRNPINHFKTGVEFNVSIDLSERLFVGYFTDLEIKNLNLILLVVYGVLGKIWLLNSAAFYYSSDIVFNMKMMVIIACQTAVFLNRLMCEIAGITLDQGRSSRDQLFISWLIGGQKVLEALNIALVFEIALLLSVGWKLTTSLVNSPVHNTIFSITIYLFVGMSLVKLWDSGVLPENAVVFRFIAFTEFTLFPLQLICLYFVHYFSRIHMAFLKAASNYSMVTVSPRSQAVFDEIGSIFRTARGCFFAFVCGRIFAGSVFGTYETDAAILAINCIQILCSIILGWKLRARNLSRFTGLPREGIGSPGRISPETELENGDVSNSGKVTEDLKTTDEALLVVSLNGKTFLAVLEK